MLRSRASMLPAAVLILTPAFAEEKKGGQPPAMGPQDKEMMDKWMTFATPGEGHKVLAAKVGTWTANVTMWHAPGAPPDTSQGTTTMEMIMDGRFLVDTTE